MSQRVTILILIDGFLQYTNVDNEAAATPRHNPYFNRWFSAMKYSLISYLMMKCHNPYFNRWFSAMWLTIILIVLCPLVTILILIDGFLQSKNIKWENNDWQSHNPYFNRWFSAIIAYKLMQDKDEGHNPYFNRWFSAIEVKGKEDNIIYQSQSLF